MTINTISLRSKGRCRRCGYKLDVERMSPTWGRCINRLCTAQNRRQAVESGHSGHIFRSIELERQK